MILKRTVLAISLMGFSVCFFQTSMAQAADVAMSPAVSGQLSAATEQDLAAQCQLRLMQQAHIDDQQQKITNMMQVHRYIGLLVKVGGAAALSYVAYRSLKSMLWSSGETVVVPVGTTAAAGAPAHIQISQKDGERLIKELNKVNPGFFTFQWWKNNAVWLVNSVACSAALGLLGTYSRKYMHEESIDWFVAENTRIKALAEELLACHGQTLAKSPAVQPAAQDLYLHRVTLAGMARSLVEQAELVAGFMEYRLAYFKKQGVVLLPDEILQPTRLVATVNNCIAAVQQKLVVQVSADTLDQVRALCGMVVQGVTELQQLINRFQGIEYGIQWRMLNGK